MQISNEFGMDQSKFKKRLEKEMKNNAMNKDFKFVALNPQYWYFEFAIQSGTYAGQTHILEIKLIYGSPPNIYMYPTSGPKCTFMTQIWHPNISDKGNVCLDVLKDNWSPIMVTASILNAIKLLLDKPNVSSPQNSAAAKMMRDAPEIYKKTVHEFYAAGKCPAEIKKMFA